MSHNRWVQMVAVFCLIAALLGAGWISTYVEAPHDTGLADVSSQLSEALPPHMAFLTVMLSVVRGIAVDILWYRAQSLQQDGKFYEINQLCELITALQPHFDDVWVFHSWNMAFNISVLTKTPDERWDWINKGIVLLRDNGLVLNPKSYPMYKELDWLFYFKIGQYSDDFNWYYKAKLALEWQQLLGEQPEGLTSAQAADEFAKVADAPNTLDQVIHGDVKLGFKPHPHVADLVSKLQSIGFQPDERLVIEVGRIKMFVLSPEAQFEGYSFKRPVDFVSAPLCAIMADPKYAGDFEPLLNHLRRRVLIEHYKMDPAFMLSLMRQYGPLDWRHFDSHSLYWASEGTRVAVASRNKSLDLSTNIDLLNTYRGAIHSIQDLMFRGRMTFDPMVDPPRLDYMPDPRFIPAYDQAFDLAKQYMSDTEASKVFGAAADSSFGNKSSFEQGHSNFLQTAVQFCYLYGDRDQAEFYYEKLRKLYGHGHFGGPARYEKPLEDFIHDNLLNNLDTFYVTQQFVQSMIINGFTRGLAINRPQVYERFIDLARAAHDKWNKGREVLANRDQVPRDRQKLLPFDQMVGEVFVDLMNRPNMPTLTRAQVWQATPDELRRRVFDRLVESVRSVAKRDGLDPTRVFPEPPGMAEYRRLHPVAPGTMETTTPDASHSPVHVERQ